MGKRQSSSINLAHGDIRYEDSNAVFQTSEKGSQNQHPYLVDNQTVKFELDIGSTVTLVSESSLHQIPPLQPPSSVFRSCTGDNVNVHSVFTAEAVHRGELLHLPVHVVRGCQQPNLLGRNWIKSMLSVSAALVKTLLHCKGTSVYSKPTLQVSTVSQRLLVFKENLQFTVSFTRPGQCLMPWA